MAFVNEIISDDDLQKYGIAEINDRECVATYQCKWTRDRERDIYLRWMRADRDQPGRNEFMFYWKGTIFPVVLKREGEGVRGGKGSNTWSIWKNNDGDRLWLPPELEVSRKDVINDLKEALVAYKDFGLLSVIVDHTAKFTF